MPWDIILIFLGVCLYVFCIEGGADHIPEIHPRDW